MRKVIDEDKWNEYRSATLAMLDAGMTRKAIMNALSLSSATIWGLENRTWEEHCEAKKNLRERNEQRRLEKKTTPEPVQEEIPATEDISDSERIILLLVEINEKLGKLVENQTVKTSFWNGRNS